MSPKGAHNTAAYPLIYFEEHQESCLVDEHRARLIPLQPRLPSYLWLTRQWGASPHCCGRCSVMQLLSGTLW